MERPSPLVEGLRLERRGQAADLNHHAGSGEVVGAAATNAPRQI